MPVTPFKPFIISAQVGLAQKMEKICRSLIPVALILSYGKLLMKNIQRGWCAEPGFIL